MPSELGTIECAIENCLTDRDGSLVMALRATSRERRSVEQILEKVRSGQTDPNKRLITQFSWYKEKRSLNANSYFHVLVGKIAKALNTSEEDIKRTLVIDYGAQAGSAVLPDDVKPEALDIKYYRYTNGVVSPKGVKCSQYIVYKVTHLLDTAEMARLIDGTVSEAQQLGIETKTPEELDKIKSLWTQGE